MSVVRTKVKCLKTVFLLLKGRLQNLNVLIFMNLQQRIAQQRLFVKAEAGAKLFHSVFQVCVKFQSKKKFIKKSVINNIICKRCSFCVLVPKIKMLLLSHVAKIVYETFKEKKNNKNTMIVFIHF